MTPFPKPPRKLQKVRACTEVANWNASFPAQGMAERKAVNYSLLDSVGEGEGGMIWENGIETCIISYKK